MYKSSILSSTNLTFQSGMLSRYAVTFKTNLITALSVVHPCHTLTLFYVYCQINLGQKNLIKSEIRFFSAFLSPGVTVTDKYLLQGAKKALSNPLKSIIYKSILCSYDTYNQMQIIKYTGCSLNIVFFPKILKYIPDSGLSRFFLGVYTSCLDH